MSRFWLFTAASWRMRQPHTHDKERPSNVRSVAACDELKLSAIEVQTLSRALVIFLIVSTPNFDKGGPLYEHLIVEVYVGRTHTIIRLQTSIRRKDGTGNFGGFVFVLDLV